MANCSRIDTAKAVLRRNWPAFKCSTYLFQPPDGRRLVMPRYTEPDSEQALLLHHLNLILPQQLPPRITTSTSSNPFAQLKM